MTANRTTSGRDYRPIEHYGFLADCHSSALVSRDGSIDWCCMPRLDSRSVFARLLDSERGGYCQIRPEGKFRSGRRYLDSTLVLETIFETDTGKARLLDCMTMRRGGRLSPRKQILRVIEGLEGSVDFAIRVSPRFDYGTVKPWIQRHGRDGFPRYSVIGGADGLLVSGLPELERDGRHDLKAAVAVRAGGRARLSIIYRKPEAIDDGYTAVDSAEELDAILEETLDWWRHWAKKGGARGPHADLAMRSAVVLKGLTNAPTGAIAAAATTSLPEAMDGDRNWDYRFSWIRDSVFTVRALHDLGFEQEADGFRRFIERSAAGSAEELQIMYGLGGERCLDEREAPGLEGWRGRGPVRLGNDARRQVQHDLYGELLELARRWQERGSTPDDDYWEFLCETVGQAVRHWNEPDRGIWEVRGEPRHFVHSKVACWAAMDCGIHIAESLGRNAPLEEWRAAREAVREAVETRGYDEKRGIYLQSFEGEATDAALLLLPLTGYVDFDDPRFRRTVDAVMDELMEDGFLRRYDHPETRNIDGLEGREGVFLACSFWLVQCLAKQGRTDEARELFERCASLGNDLGLFSEEYDPHGGCMLGNFPQGLTHLSLIAASQALADPETTRQPG